LDKSRKRIILHQGRKFSDFWGPAAVGGYWRFLWTCYLQATILKGRRDVTSFIVQKFKLSTSNIWAPALVR